MRQRPALDTGCRRVGRREVYSWRDKDPSFDQKMAEAHEGALDALEEEAPPRG